MNRKYPPFHDKQQSDEKMKREKIIIKSVREYTLITIQRKPIKMSQRFPLETPKVMYFNLEMYIKANNNCSNKELNFKSDENIKNKYAKLKTASIKKKGYRNTNHHFTLPVIFIS